MTQIETKMVNDLSWEHSQHPFGTWNTRLNTCSSCYTAWKQFKRKSTLEYIATRGRGGPYDSNLTGSPEEPR